MVEMDGREKRMVGKRKKMVEMNVREMRMRKKMRTEMLIKMMQIALMQLEGWKRWMKQKGFLPQMGSF